MTAGEPTTSASIVICTRNRHDKIAAAVAGALAQDHPSFDVTVIDQSTTDETRVALEPFAGDGRLRYVHSELAGLSRAYNRGVAETTGEILAFTDDDCIVKSDWLPNITSAFAGEPDVDLIYGRVDPLGVSPSDVSGTPFLAMTEIERLSKRDGFRVVSMGANFAARRRLFATVGGFDQVLGGGGPLRSSQDHDLTYRTYRAGLVTMLRPEIVVTHDGYRAPEEWPALLRAYGIGDGAFYMKHVRCRDLRAAWLLCRKLGVTTAKWVAKWVIPGRDPGSFGYVSGFFAGMYQSFSFKIDRAARVYIEGDG